MSQSLLKLGIGYTVFIILFTLFLCIFEIFLRYIVTFFNCACSVITCGPAPPTTADPSNSHSQFRIRTPVLQGPGIQIMIVCARLGSQLFTCLPPSRRVRGRYCVPCSRTRGRVLNTFPKVMC